MKIITPGHKYSLASFEGGPEQQIQFIEKIRIEGGALRTTSDGTTNEEMLAVLIDRLDYLQHLCPCRENAIVITKLEEALMWLNKRTADRKARNVEGKAAA